MIRLEAGPIGVAELIAHVRRDGDGAVASFIGTTRATSGGRPVLHLEYEAYAPMAERELEKIEAMSIERFDISRVAIVHRIGRVEIGEASVAIAVAAPHRAAAMDACRFIIDTLKATVPIWKREHFADGAVWVGDETAPS